MDGDEQQLVLKGFNHTSQPYDTTSLVHRMFAEHAQRQPEAPCVIHEDRVYSYAEVRWFVLVSIHAQLAPLLTRQSSMCVPLLASVVVSTVMHIGTDMC